MTTHPKWTVTAFDPATETLPDDWQHLNVRCCNAHPLLDPMFLEPLLRHFGKPGVHLARLDIDGECAGVALVVRLHIGRWALFQPSQAPLGPIIVDQARISASEAIQCLIRSLPGLALELDLTFLDPEYSPLTGHDSLTEQVLHATTMGISTGEGFEAYWSTRKNKLRSNLRRYHRRLEEGGIEPVLEVMTEPQQMGAAVDAYGDLESAGWKGQAGTAIHRDNQQGRAYREIMHSFAEAGRGTVYLMKIDDKLAACRLIIHSGGMAVMLKTTFDEALSSCAVGRILLYHALQYLFEREDTRVIEFYTNANADQLQWSNISRPIYHMTCYRNQPVRIARRGLRALLSPVRKSRTD